MKTSEILDKAADVMDKHGQAKNHFIKEKNGPCCVIGSIHVAMGGEHAPCTAAHGPAIDSLARNVVDRAVGCAHLYNENNPAPSVIAMLRACAMTERAREARMLPVVRETVEV